VASQEPDLKGLGLETAGVAYTQCGVEVDDRLRTTNRRVFAAGNVCGGRFAPPEMAEAMARLCVHNAFHLRSKRLSRTVVPRCIWTDPEIVGVGLTPAEAAERGIEIDTYRAEMSEIAAAVLDGHDEGFVIVYARHGTGRILGGTIVAARASELIGPLGLMIARRISLDALADSTACRPSRFEVFALIADCYRRNQSPSRWRMLREKLRACWRRA
jgi:pyruvate/2-oxoglutarate dehydrogenase complex dihydrolipoamide dehydrogenase (E3) component